MDPAIEQILLAKAAQEAEQNPSIGQAAGLGAAGGSLLGAAAATPMHYIGKGVGKLKGTNSRFKPGMRMAGGLVGLLTGGGLGAAAQQAAIADAGPAGALLAKIQAQGGMTLEDERAVEQVLREAYSQQGLLG